MGNLIKVLGKDLENCPHFFLDFESKCFTGVRCVFLCACVCCWRWMSYQGWSTDSRCKPIHCVDGDWHWHRMVIFFVCLFFLRNCSFLLSHHGLSSLQHQNVIHCFLERAKRTRFHCDPSDHATIARSSPSPGPSKIQTAQPLALYIPQNPHTHVYMNAHPTPETRVPRLPWPTCLSLLSLPGGSWEISWKCWLAAILSMAQ